MEIIQIPIGKIKPDPNQPRKSFNSDKIEGLAQSIVTTGIINPIEIDKNFIIVTGEYRWRAALEAGLKEIPCKIIEKIEPYDRFMRQVIENVQYTEMTPWDTGIAFKKLLNLLSPGESKIGQWGGQNEIGITKLAEKIGKPPSVIEEYIWLVNEASKPIQKAIKKNELSISQIRIIKRAPEKYRKRIEQKILNKEFTHTYKEDKDGRKRWDKGSTRDAGLEMVEAIKRNPDKAEEILGIDYSKYETTNEVAVAISHISPRWSDRMEIARNNLKQLSLITDALLDWLENNPIETLGLLDAPIAVIDLDTVRDEINKYLSNKPNQKSKKLLKEQSLTIK